jgi:hypothetical protein
VELGDGGRRLVGRLKLHDAAALRKEERGGVPGGGTRVSNGGRNDGRGWR